MAKDDPLPMRIGWRLAIGFVGLALPFLISATLMRLDQHSSDFLLPLLSLAICIPALVSVVASAFSTSVFLVLPASWIAVSLLSILYFGIFLSFYIAGWTSSRGLPVGELPMLWLFLPPSLLAALVISSVLIICDRRSWRRTSARL